MTAFMARYFFAISGVYEQFYVNSVCKLLIYELFTHSYLFAFFFFSVLTIVYSNISNGQYTLLCFVQLSCVFLKQNALRAALF